MIEYYADRKKQNDLTYNCRRVFSIQLSIRIGQPSYANLNVLWCYYYYVITANSYELGRHRHIIRMTNPPTAGLLGFFPAFRLIQTVSSAQQQQNTQRQPQREKKNKEFVFCFFFFFFPETRESRVFTNCVCVVYRMSFALCVPPPPKMVRSLFFRE